MFAQLRFAHKVICDPADGERAARNQDALPQREVRLGRVEQENLAADPIDDHQQGSS